MASNIAGLRLYMGKNKYEIHFKEIKSNYTEKKSEREKNIIKNAQVYTSYIQEMIEKHPKIFASAKGAFGILTTSPKRVH
jgi:hypothetical protein